ncbi:MAG: hypothetical protein N3G79_07025 [Sulfolobales archaeon]|nr:hypothetical protein [Sulfolobales archaeon]
MAELLKPVEPTVVEVDYSSDVRLIDERRLEACFNNFVVFMKRVREKGVKYYISVYAGGGSVTNVFRGEVVDVNDLEDPKLNLDVELKNRLKFYISAWDLMFEKSKAEIYLNARVKVVPKVSDREIIAERIADAVLEDVSIKTFTVNQGGKTVVVGVYCYEGGYYKECEEEIKKKVEEYIRGYELQEGKVTRWVVSEVVSKIMRRTYEDYRYEKHTLIFKDKLFRWPSFLNTKDFEQSISEPNPNIIVEHRIPWKINLENLNDRIERVLPDGNEIELAEEGI